MKKPAFDCQRCSQCCHGEGGISLRAEEVPPAAALLGLESSEFVATYCVERQGAYYIKTNQAGDCALLGPQGCRIHQAKPRICQAWPYFQAMLKDPGAFEEAKLICPGLSPEATHEEFLAQYRAESAKEVD